MHDRKHGHAHDHATNGPEACGPDRPIVRQEHNSSVASTTGWSIWAEQVFDAARIRQWIEEVTARPSLRRLKAVVRTDEGWFSVNIADGAQASKPSAYRRDSRLEIVWMGPSRPDPEEIESGLLSCFVSAST